MDRETSLQQRIEYSLAGDLPDYFARLRHKLDKMEFSPVSEVRHYEFSNGAILYAYPPEVRSLLEVYQSDVVCVTVTTHEQSGVAPTFSIRIYTDSAGVLEIAPPMQPDSQSAFVLNQVENQNTDYPLTAQEVGQLLISMAVSPSNSADIDQARRANDGVVEPLDPRNPSVFYLLKNCLDDYASESSAVARYALQYDTPYEDTVVDVDLFITQSSNGTDCYDVTISTSYTETGYASAFDISARCYSGADSQDNEFTIQANRTVFENDSSTFEPFDKTAATAYVASVIEALADSPLTLSKSIQL
jgi:hypothetical protein